jgi:two-component system sensor kinase FixL
MPDLKLIREILADIATDDRRAGDVIQRLRDLLKKREPKFEAVACAPLVDSVVKLARGDLRTRVVAVSIEMVGQLPPVQGDQVQLQQVLLNLVVNAADAMRELPASERSVRITAGRGDTGTIVFAIADRGHGIPDTAQSQLFQPFFTTKAKGLGMGLAISRSIAEAHRGQLWATNNPDRGATFFLKLPVARA